jgi:hypothetical protein
LKNIRILIVSNPLTAIFMNARLSEVESEGNDTETIIFYEERLLDSGYSENSTKREEENKQYALSLFKNKYKIFYPTEIYYRNSTFLNLLKNHKNIKQEQLDNQLKLKLFINESKLSSENIVEIWHGNTQWHKYLKLFFPSAATFKFDHGLTETLMYFEDSKKTLPHCIYSKLNLRKIFNYLGGLYFVTPPIDTKPNAHFTLNSREINAALGYEITKPISPNGVQSITSFSLKKNIDFGEGASLAIVLLDNIKPWAKLNSDHAEYFNDFESMLLSNCTNNLVEKGIKTIVFKPKHWQEEFAQDAIKSFDRLGKLFELKYFPDFFENLPLEYFLESLRPKIIIGNLSSGLYYAKHLLPKVETYTYDNWFVDYTMRKFGTTFPDFEIMRPILYGSQAKYFENINPVNISQCKESILNDE